MSDTIGARLRAARRAAGMSQAALSHRSGVQQSTLSRIEVGDVNDPGVLMLARCAWALGVTLDDLVRGVAAPATVARPTLEQRVAACETALRHLGVIPQP